MAKKGYIDLQDYYMRRERSRMTSAAALAVCTAGALVVVILALLISLAQGCSAKAERREVVPAIAITAGYPDPVCPWCGGIMDGHGCQCDGGGCF